MAQPADEKQQSNSDTVWPTALLLNQAYAMTFACVKCNGMPKSCMNNDEGDILCKGCCKDMDNISSNKAMQKIVDNLKTKCFSIKTDNEVNIDSVEGGNVIATQAKDNECDWTGKIKEWIEHSKECPFIIVTCNDCQTFQCQRQFLDKHIAECPEVTIDCPKSCGSRILRKNKKTHFEKDCAETLLNCTNDDCKMQIKRKDFNNHIENECDVRVVQCEFAKYGCSVKQLKANQLEQHMLEYKFDHISSKFDFITSKQNEVISTLTEKLNENAILKSTVEKQQQTIQKMDTKLNGLTNEQNKVISTLTEKTNENAVLQTTVEKQQQTIQQMEKQFNDLTNKISEMEEKKEPTLWKDAAYWNDDTGMQNSGGWKCLVHMTLPQKKGKYVCRYSTQVLAQQKGGYWITYAFKLGSARLCSNKNGTYMHKNMNNYPFPLSGSAIIDLSGNENDEQRKLGLYHCPQQNYPSRMAYCFVEAYQIE